MTRNPTLAITPEASTRVLVWIVVALVVLDLLGVVSTLYLGHDYLLGLIPLFYLDAEQNVPTLFSSALFLAGAGLSAVVWRARARSDGAAVVWALLALLLAFLALDEFAMIHEKFLAPIHERFQTTGLLYFAWYIPYSALVVVAVAVFLPTILRLSRRARNLFLAAGAVFVAGAIGFESLAGLRAERILGTVVGADWPYELLTAAEEALEMLGLILLIRAFLVLLRTEWDGVLVRLGGASDERAAAP